jgi:hypothetical protein
VDSFSREAPPIPFHANNIGHKVGVNSDFRICPRILGCRRRMMRRQIY